MTPSIWVGMSQDPEGQHQASNTIQLLPNSRNVNNSINGDDSDDEKVPYSMNNDVVVDASQIHEYRCRDEHQQYDTSRSTSCQHLDSKIAIDPRTWISVLGHSNKQQELVSSATTTTAESDTQHKASQIQSCQPQQLIRCRSYAGTGSTIFAAGQNATAASLSSSSASSTTRQCRSDDFVSTSSSMIAVTTTAEMVNINSHSRNLANQCDQQIAGKEQLERYVQGIVNVDDDDIDCEESDSIKEMEDDTETNHQHPVWNEPLFVVSTIDEYEPKKGRRGSSTQTQQQSLQYQEQYNQPTRLVQSARFLSMNILPQHDEPTDYMIINNKTTGNRTMPGRQYHHNIHQRQQSVNSKSNYSQSQRHPKLWSLADLMLFEEVSAMVTSGKHTTSDTNNNDTPPEVVTQKEPRQQLPQDKHSKVAKMQELRQHNDQVVTAKSRIVPPREIRIPSYCLNRSKFGGIKERDEIGAVTDAEAALTTSASATSFNNYNDSISVCTYWTTTDMNDLSLLDKLDEPLKADDVSSAELNDRIAESIPMAVEVSCRTTNRTLTSNYEMNGSVKSDTNRIHEEHVGKYKELEDEEEEENDNEDEDNSEYESKNICFDSINEVLSSRLLLSNLISSSRDSLEDATANTQGVEYIPISPACSSLTNAATTTNTNDRCALNNVYGTNDNNNNRKIEYNATAATTSTTTKACTINHHRLSSITHNLRWGIMTATLDDK